MSSIVQTVQDENIEVNFKDAMAVFSSLIILRLAVAAAQRCRSQFALYNQRHENPSNISAEPVFFSKKKKKSVYFFSEWTLPKSNIFSKKRSLSFICLKTRSGTEGGNEEENIREEVVRERDRDKKGEEYE